MEVVYNGPQPTRTVELGPGKDIVANQGEPFTVDPEIGKRLVNQRHFAEATGRTITTAPAAPTTNDSASTDKPAPDPSASAGKKGA